MKNKLSQALMIAITFCFMGAARTSSMTAEEAVAQTLRLMYVALANEDTAQLRAVITPDFYAFDGGERFNGDELMTLIKSLHAAGKTIVWTVPEPTVRIEGTVAWITYTNRGSSQDAAGKKDVSWLESAVLLKEAGTWRIQFFHSTRVPAK
jgi:ketosteroid isomerase-like protein